MNDVVERWVAKAVADLATARREAAVAVEPNFDAVCFHAQQCAEKLLKALLITFGQEAPRSHDLTMLSDRVAGCVPGWTVNPESLRQLSQLGIDARYPEDSATADEAANALDTAVRLHATVMTLFETLEDVGDDGEDGPPS